MNVLVLFWIVVSVTCLGQRKKTKGQAFRLLVGANYQIKIRNIERGLPNQPLWQNLAWLSL